MSESRAATEIVAQVRNVLAAVGLVLGTISGVSGLGSIAEETGKTFALLGTLSQFWRDIWYPVFPFFGLHISDLTKDFVTVIFGTVLALNATSYLTHRRTIGFYFALTFDTLVRRWKDYRFPNEQLQQLLNGCRHIFLTKNHPDWHRRLYYRATLALLLLWIIPYQLVSFVIVAAFSILVVSFASIVAPFVLAFRVYPKTALSTTAILCVATAAAYALRH
jgi:hypothetical protein